MFSLLITIVSSFPSISNLVASVTILKNYNAKNWFPQTVEEFLPLKNAFASVSVLHHPDLPRPFFLEDEPFFVDMGAVLSQRKKKIKILTTSSPRLSKTFFPA